VKKEKNLPVVLNNKRKHRKRINKPKHLVQCKIMRSIAIAIILKIPLLIPIKNSLKVLNHNSQKVLRKNQNDLRNLKEKEDHSVHLRKLLRILKEKEIHLVQWKDML